MPYRASAQAVLEHWYDAEREYEAAPGIAGRIVFREEMDRLRGEYDATINAARKASMPVPGPFPDRTDGSDSYLN